MTTGISTRARSSLARASTATRYLCLLCLIALSACSTPDTKTAEVEPPASAAAGCAKDTDCKGDRICERGVCTAPAAASPPSAEARPPAAEEQAPSPAATRPAPPAGPPERITGRQVDAVAPPQLAGRLTPEEVDRMYGWGAPSVLERDPRLLKLIKQLQPSFKERRVATSQAPQVVRLPDGRQLALLWGCTPHECGGSTYQIAYDANNQTVAFLAEQEIAGSDREYLLFGAPDDAVRQVLLHSAKSE